MTDAEPTGSGFDGDVEALAIDVIRGLAMDAPHAARSGHQGTAMALAPLAHVLWTRILTYDAADPSWPDRDRFILSAGHASILLYSMLHLTGHGLTLDDLRDFRQWGSATPGHPEAGHTAGVEVTTGPLGRPHREAISIGSHGLAPGILLFVPISICQVSPGAVIPECLGRTRRLGIVK